MRPNHEVRHFQPVTKFSKVTALDDQQTVAQVEAIQPVTGARSVTQLAPVTNKLIKRPGLSYVSNSPHRG